MKVQVKAGQRAEASQTVLAQPPPTALRLVLIPFALSTPFPLLISALSLHARLGGCKPALYRVHLVCIMGRWALRSSQSCRARAPCSVWARQRSAHFSRTAAGSPLQSCCCLRTRACCPPLASACCRVAWVGVAIYQAASVCLIAIVDPSYIVPAAALVVAVHGAPFLRSLSAQTPGPIALRCDCFSVLTPSLPLLGEIPCLSNPFCPSSDWRPGPLSA
jgi:hypothetical protein